MGKRTKAKKPTDDNKPWRKREIARKFENIIAPQYIKSFRIYCEGKNTEPEYFNSFRIDKERVLLESVGLSRTKTSLVEKVIEITKDFKKDEDNQIWVVFDRDVQYEYLENRNQDFNNAIQLAEKHQIRCAYSNDCFELWFVLHDEFLSSALHRKQLYDKLSDRLNCNYEKDGKSKEFSGSLYGIFKDRIENAKDNAKRLLLTHSGVDFSNHNPCTTVHLLVEELQKNERK